MKNVSLCGIPKIIYYFWVGPNPIPELCLKCIDSWHKFMPTYKIIMVCDSMLDLNANIFVTKAIEAKRYGYAVDYLRIKWMYEHGGLYFDTDVELIKSIDDIVNDSEFFAFQNQQIAVGLGFAVKKHSAILKKIMKQYDEWNENSFIGRNGFPVVPPAPTFNANIFIEEGVRQDNSLQRINGVTYYPEIYFSPQSFITRELKIDPQFTRSIHYGTGFCNDPIDLWMNRYRSKILRINPTANIDSKIFKIKTLILHPIKALKYHYKHRYHV